MFELESYLVSSALLCTGHVARMPKSLFPKRMVLPWLRAPRVTRGQEMAYGRSLERLAYFRRFSLLLA